MRERLSRWMTTLSAAAVVAAGALSVGCGPYEQEPEYPQGYQYVAPPPPTAAELAAQQQAREQAANESREILVGAETDEYTDTDPSALTEFKPALDNHGTWVDDSTYGTVWVPASAEVGTDFQPYVSAGHWTYSDASDYVWVSDYSWGWAPFHYGRWVSLPGHGWSWIPGRRYAGAWVTWRTGPSGYGYVGWAPMGPSWYWYRGSAIGWSFGYYHPYDHYVYCPHSHVYYGAVSTHVVRGPAAREHYGRTQDYVPASPGVGGGDRKLANPSVNGGGDRVVANPSVGGDRIAAKPAVAGQRVLASPTKGPRPDELGIKNDVIVAPPSGNQGLDRAQVLATPRTAVAAGAVGPAHLRPDLVNPGANREPASAAFVPRSGNGNASVQPQNPNATYAAPGPSSPSSPPAYRSAPSYTPSSPGYASQAPAYRSAPPPSVSSPSYRSSPSYSSSPPPSVSSPSFRSSPSYRSAPPPSVSSPSFRSSPSTPSYRSAPPPSVSSPSFRSSPSTPSFRSSPPPMVSRPSTPSFRSSAPSVSAPRSSGNSGVKSNSGGSFRRR